MCFFPFILSQKDSSILFHLYVTKFFCFSLSGEFGSASSIFVFLFLIYLFTFNEDSLFEKNKNPKPNKQVDQVVFCWLPY